MAWLIPGTVMRIENLEEQEIPSAVSSNLTVSSINLGDPIIRFHQYRGYFTTINQDRSIIQKETRFSRVVSPKYMLTRVFLIFLSRKYLGCSIFVQAQDNIEYSLLQTYKDTLNFQNFSLLTKPIAQSSVDLDLQFQPSTSIWRGVT